MLLRNFRLIIGQESRCVRQEARDVTCQKVFEIDGEENKQRCSFSEQSVRHSSAPSLFTKKEKCSCPRDGANANVTRKIILEVKHAEDN